MSKPCARRRRNTARINPQPRLRLTEARILRDWSQQYVADRIGTTHVNISRWERGITKPNPYFRRKLCQLFGKTEQELDLEPAADAAVPTAASSTPPRASGVGAGLDESIHAFSPALDSAIPLKPDIRLVGRDKELATLRQRLCAGRSVALTALNGLPGVGKTAVSIALAYDPKIRAHFRDGILWAGLGPSPNIAGQLSRWGTLLGISAAETATLSSKEEWAKALRVAIGSRSMLLVIDDAWKVEEALTFKVGGPNCAHLVTTRFPSIATSITVDGAIEIQELSEDESMALLDMLAPGVADRESKNARDLVQAVGGLPLAIRLVGNYLRKQVYSGQPRRVTAALERLKDAEERLQLSEPNEPVETHSSLSTDTPLSLQSVISVTDQQLSEQARTTLYALSVFPSKPSSFSEEAALAVASCSLDTLDTLMDAGLLETSSSGRYTLHQTIADYARMHLKDNAAYERLIAYVTNSVEAHKKNYELLEVESTIVLAALEVAYERGRGAEFVRCACAFAPFLLSRGLYALAERHLKRAYEVAKADGDIYGTTGALLYLGEIAQKQGDYTQAEAAFQEGLTIARQIGDRERISALLADLGWVTWKRGEYAQAEVYLQEGLNIAHQIGDRERISGILEILGSVAGSRGNYGQSEAYLEEGLTIARQLGDRERLCTMLINMGATVGEQGNYAQAEEYFQEGLLLARQIGHREWISVLLSNLGDAVGEQGNYAQAEEYFQEGLLLARQIGHREWISALLSNLGLTTRKQGKYSQAEEYFKESLTLARQIGRPLLTTNALYEYGNLYLDQQRIEEAEEYFREMLTIIPQGDQELVALAQYGLARVAEALGNIYEARRLGEASAGALETMGHRNAKEVKYWLNLIMG